MLGSRASAESPERWILFGAGVQRVQRLRSDGSSQGRMVILSKRTLHAVMCIVQVTSLVGLGDDLTEGRSEGGKRD